MPPSPGAAEKGGTGIPGPPGPVTAGEPCAGLLHAGARGPAGGIYLFPGGVIRRTGRAGGAISSRADSTNAPVSAYTANRAR